MDNIKSDRIKNDDFIILMFYNDDSNNAWILGIRLDENVNKTKQIYGSEPKKCKLLFREKFKNQLALDFKVE